MIVLDKNRSGYLRDSFIWTFRPNVLFLHSLAWSTSSPLVRARADGLRTAMCVSNLFTFSVFYTQSPINIFIPNFVAFLCSTMSHIQWISDEFFWGQNFLESGLFFFCDVAFFFLQRPQIFSIFALISTTEETKQKVTKSLFRGKNVLICGMLWCKEYRPVHLAVIILIQTLGSPVDSRIRQSRSGFEPWPGHSVVLWGKTIYSQSASLGTSL